MGTPEPEEPPLTWKVKKRMQAIEAIKASIEYMRLPLPGEPPTPNPYITGKRPWEKEMKAWRVAMRKRCNDIIDIDVVGLWDLEV